MGGRPFFGTISRISGTLVMLAIFAAASFGLIFLAGIVAREDRSAGSDDEPGSGMMIRSEVIRLYLPRTLIELAKRQTLPSRILTHDDLRRILEVRRHKDLWYALTVRGLQVNGEFVELTFVRRPYFESRGLRNSWTSLPRPRRTRPTSASRFSSAKITVIPDELSERDAREVISLPIR